ncbi:MAG: DUF3849 domain-containing protein [Candidatus Faecousia sp.]|nr:DUF3849 domain-containing protein [Candidatus Faecousia sp.]
MNNQELNTALYEKMFAEQDTYRKWLLTQSPEEILNHTYEYTIREDILLSLEYHDLTDAQAAALLKSSTPLADVFKEFDHRETDHMDQIFYAMEERADDVLEAEEKQRRILRETPVYPYPASYAREHDELEQYRASHKANVACNEAIEAAISAHYSDNRLGKQAALEVIEAFGMDRTMYVLANTVRHKDWDGRISQDNKRWAMTIPVFEDTDSWGHDRNTEFVVDKSHPGLTDLFVDQARREQLLRTPLTDEEIQREAERLLTVLRAPKEPNSPNGTHFMAQISPDFLARASTKDTDRLMATLPFRSTTFSGLNDRKGHFVLITKDEDRSQPLRKLRRSVRKDLQKTSAKSAPAASKKHKQEREAR